MKEFSKLYERAATRKGGEAALATSSGMGAITALLWTYLEPGDEIIMPLPYYFNHAMWLELDGVTPVFLHCGPDLLPDPAEAEKLISSRTRAILLVSPGNPSGVTVPPAIIDAFGELASRHGIALILDETYRTFRESEEPPHSLFADPNWGETVVSLHSFSKDLAIPGYRVGAAIANSDLLYEAAKLLDCMAICAPRIGQEAVVAGLQDANDWRQEQVRRIHAGLKTFRSVMSERPGGFELITSGAFFGWVRHPFDDVSTADVVKRLVLDHDVLVIPGTAFLPTDDRWLRLSFANLESDDFAELGRRLEATG